MTREQSWRVAEQTFDTLSRITGLDYVVSVHRLPFSLLEQTRPAVEMHAIQLGTDPVIQYVVSVEGEGGDIELWAATELMRMVSNPQVDAPTNGESGE